MLSRCRLNRAPKCVRCISIPAPAPAPYVSSSVKKQDESAKSSCSDDELWKSLLKDIPTPAASSQGGRRLPNPGRRGSLAPDFFSSQRFGQSRKYSTKAAQKGSPPNPDEPESLFSSSQSAWDHVFDDIDNMPPLETMTPAAPRSRSTARVTSPTATRARRQTMTAREIDAFDNMFNMIFNAVSEQRARDGSGTGPGKAPSTTKRQDPLTGAGIGNGPDGASTMSDLFGKLRLHSKKFKWSAAEDAELERKKAQMELCDTDHRLLEWAMREVFDESARYEEAARQAVARAEAAAAAPRDAARANNTAAPASPLPLQPPAYPHLLAELMRAFRDKFRDPHLALSVFAHARARSIASYVFGCTAPAYYELLRTRWACFRDLRGVVDALEEMRVNGIQPDGRMRMLVEEVRREVGARTIWQEERSVGTGEVLDMLNRIERLSAENMPQHSSQHKQKKSKRWNASSEQWKHKTSSSSRRVDTWKFGDWDLKKRKTTRQEPPPPPEARSPKLAFE